MINTINDILNEKKITIRELSNRCGMQYSNVYNILHGKNVPRIDTVEKMLNAIGYGIQVVPVKNLTVIYYEKAAVESRCSSDQWYRYMRKIISQNGCKISAQQIAMLLSSPKLTMYQKVVLKQAVIPGSFVNRKVISLNQKTSLPMVEKLRSKYDK